MKKPVRKTGKKISKSEFESRFAFMVAEYNKAKEALDLMEQGTSEYSVQKKKCDNLFANAERFINAN